MKKYTLGQALHQARPGETLLVTLEGGRKRHITMPRWFYALALAAFFFFGVGVGHAFASRAWVNHSYASWYGPGLYGNNLACGGRLTTGTWGVAHKSLPCGSRLVLCVRHYCTRVRVVDRGPFVAGRDLDLTAAVAQHLRLSGVQPVNWWQARKRW